MENPAEEIFADALELELGEREEFLDHACGGDADLRREVERLLADAKSADTFFAELTGGATGLPTRKPTEESGTQIGPYKLLQKIGEGGFGVVWMAEQEKPIRRMVALKVIKAGMDTEEVLARFEAERQALARMEHPNIARVLDAGATPDGRPYFAMELVKGIPITRFCDERRLETKDRLRLFLDVCAAVNHAHQKGVIHRDIKPSNVMVTLDGIRPVVKVIDFGIAKAIEGKLTDRTLFTRIEQLVGTPAYMSPEQAGLGSLDIDTRSDIYSLGAVLYELLAGVAPFAEKALVRAGYDEMRRIIREVEPARPSARITSLSVEEKTLIASAHAVTSRQLHRMVASDLDWIVMKAIEKSRDRRYETADALAKDIDRFISDQPVEAKPPTPFYLFLKFGKRHRATLQVFLGLLLLLLAGTGISTWQAIRAMKAEALAARRLTEVVQEQNAKDRALQDAEAVSRFLTDVFRRPDPEMDGRSVTVAAALDAATDKLAATLSTQPERLALLQETLAGTYAGLGIYPRSLELRRTVLETRRKCLGPENPATLDAMNRLASTLGRLGYYEEARALGEEELAARRRINGPDHPATLEAMRLLAENDFRSGRHQEAIALQKSLVDRLLAAHESSDPKSSAALLALSEYYRGVGDEKMATETARLAKPSATPAKPTKSQANDNDNEYQAKVKQSLEQIEAELARLREQHGADSRITMDFMRKLAGTYYSRRYGTDAIRVQEELAALQRAKFGEDHPDTIDIEETLTFFYWRFAQYKKCRDLRKNLIERRKKVFGPEHIDTLYAQTLLAQQMRCGSEFDPAQTLLHEVVPLLRKVAGSNDRRTLNAISELTFCYVATGRTAEALALLTECAPQMRDDTFANLLLANLQLWFGRQDEYNKTRSWVIDYATTTRDRTRDRPDILERSVLISCLAPLKNKEQGKELLATLARCREIRSAKGVPPLPNLGADWCLKITGLAHYRTGDYEAAEAALGEAVRLREEDNKTGKPVARDPLVALYRAMTMFQQGNRNAALELYLETSAAIKPPPSYENPLQSPGPTDYPLNHWLALREARGLFGDPPDFTSPVDHDAQPK